MAKRTAMHLTEHLSVFQPGYPILKGFIAKLLIVDGRAVPDVLREVRSLVHANEPDKLIQESTLSNNLHTFKKLVVKHKKQLTKEWPSLVTLFLEPFPVTFKTLSVTPTVPQPGHTSPTQHPESTYTPPLNTLLQPGISQSAHSSSSPFSASCGQSPKRLKRHCDSCVYKQRTIINMTKKIKCLRQQVKELLKASPKRKTSQLSVKRLNEKVKRQMQSAMHWRLKYKDVKEKHDDNLKRLLDLHYLKNRVSVLETALDSSLKENKNVLAINYHLSRMVADTRLKVDLHKTRLDDVKKTAELEKQRMKELHARERKKVEKCAAETSAHYENEIAMLEEKVQDSKVIKTKRNGQYDVMFRRCVYEFVLHNVSVGSVSHLLGCIGHTFFNRTFSHLPCASTVAQMAIEIGILAEVQVGYALHNCKSATLAWDSTTKAGVHINEVHVHLIISEGNEDDLTLNVSCISDGATDQLLNHITQAISDVCQTYSAAYALDFAEVKENVCKNIRSTMTDRASVNHCVHRELEKLMGDIVELKCSVHPLDGLATAARATLHKLDLHKQGRISDLKPALGCRAAQLIHQVSKLRFKDGSGDPSYFMTYLKKHGIKANIILRYVGNRLHVMFHMAAVIYCHRDILINFMITRKCRDLCKRILNGLTETTILLQLQVMGLFSKYLTGPWMSFFYDGGKRGYRLGATEFQPAIERLKGLLASPEDLCSTTVNVLGQPMVDVEPDLTHVEMATREEFLETVKKLTSSFIILLNRQLGDGSIQINESDEMIEATESAPMHNMHAERTLGMMDALMRRAPHASLGFNDAKLKAVQNKTLRWLELCPEDKQYQLVQFAVRQAPRVRQRMAEREKAVYAAVSEKHETLTRAAYQKELNSEVASKGLTPLLLDLDMFRKLDDLCKERLKNFMENDSALSDILLRHVWKQEGKNCVYYEMVRDVMTTGIKGKCKKVLDLWVWKADDIPSDDYFSMNVKQFLVDFATGGLRVKAKKK